MLQVRTFSGYDDYYAFAIEQAEQSANAFLATLDALSVRSVTAQTYESVYPPDEDSETSTSFVTHVITVVYNAGSEPQPAPAEPV